MIGKTHAAPQLSYRLLSPDSTHCNKSPHARNVQVLSLWPGEGRSFVLHLMQAKLTCRLHSLTLVLAHARHAIPSREKRLCSAAFSNYCDSKQSVHRHMPRSKSTESECSEIDLYGRIIATTTELQDGKGQSITKPSPQTRTCRCHRLARLA